jgi:hypothetical protein
LRLFRRLVERAAGRVRVFFFPFFFCMCIYIWVLRACAADGRASGDRCGRDPPSNAGVAYGQWASTLGQARFFFLHSDSFASHSSHRFIVYPFTFVTSSSFISTFHSELTPRPRSPHTPRRADALPKWPRRAVRRFQLPRPRAPGAMQRAIQQIASADELAVRHSLPLYPFFNLPPIHHAIRIQRRIVLVQRHSPLHARPAPHVRLF